MTSGINVASNSSADLVDGMKIEWDVPITIDDGIVLRADVFRPDLPGQYPVLLSYGPYGRGLPFKDGFPLFWSRLLQDHPEIVKDSSGAYQVYELVDPEIWVPAGYVCVRVDARGAGRSEGHLDLSSSREAHDIHDCIEWAAEQPWSSGRIGLAGISYYAMNQWRTAALQPPHLSAICVWEGAGDIYRDACYQGGIPTTFVNLWFQGVLRTQHGVGTNGPSNPNSGQLVGGDYTASDEELTQWREDFPAVTRAHPFIDDYHRSRQTDWSKIEVALLSAGNWGGHGLHLRGSTRGFELAGTDRKWLDMHNGTHFSEFYSPAGVALQKSFFDRFLKDEENGWEKRPSVHLATRRADGGFEERSSSAWPLPETVWTEFNLDVANKSMTPGKEANPAAASYKAGEGSLSFRFTASERIEIAGPVAAKLFIESDTTDADLFLTLRAFAPDGTETVFVGANDPHTPVSQGWLRASHRALDPDQSRPFLPVHSHLVAEPLAPGSIYEVDVEILPTSLILPTGYSLVLDIQGHDYVYPPAIENGAQTPLGVAMTGSGPFLHNDPEQRPPEVFGRRVILHAGGEHRSYLLLPVIPA